MKKVIVFVLSSCCLFLCFCFIFVDASSWKFLWENTTVSVPLGDSIEKYKNIPKATLYKDNVALTNSSITYNTEGDWLYYFKDVNTHKVGKYSVWYKAYDSVNSPGTCTGYKALVTFSVEDHEKPRIDIINPVLYVARGDEVHLDTNYYVSDNGIIKEVKVIGTVDTMQIKTYDVKIWASDESNNTQEATFKVTVYEDTYPSITCIDSMDTIEAPLNGSLDLSLHFLAKDRVEGDITSKIVYPEVSLSAVGEFKYSVKVSNSAGMETEYPFIVKVVDNQKPEIYLTTTTLLLDYKTNLKGLDLRQYIKEIRDNQEINWDNLTIKTNLVSKVGIYTIWYSYTDGKYTVEESIDVRMMSYEKPVITVDSIEIFENDNPNLRSYIHIKDDSDSNIMGSLEIYDSTVDYTKAGTYYAECYCINSSGLSESVRFMVVVKKKGLVSGVSNASLFTMIALALGLISVLGYIVFTTIKKKKQEV